MYDRLKQLCSEKNTTITKLCEIVTGSGGNLATWKKGYMRSDYLMKAAEHLDVTSDYLLGLDTEPNRKTPLSEDKQRLLEMYDLLTEREQGEILGELKALTRDKLITVATAAHNGGEPAIETITQEQLEALRKAKPQTY